jgi:hypothetical protein
MKRCGHGPVKNLDAGLPKLSEHQRPFQECYSFPELEMRMILHLLFFEADRIRAYHQNLVPTGPELEECLLIILKKGADED